MQKFLYGITGVLSWIVYVIIIAALLIASPLIFGFKPVVVLSGSMVPAYPVGSIIYYKDVPFDEIQVGDAITFKFGESSLATHRVQEIDTDAQTFVTKGDANETADTTPVSYDKVVGKATKIAIPNAGYFVGQVRQLWVIVVMGGILLLHMVLAPDEKRKQWEALGIGDSVSANKTKDMTPIRKKETPKKGKLTAQEYFKDL